MFKNMTIKMKLVLSFSLIGVLIAILAGYSNYGISKSSNGFSDYRVMAKNSVLASDVEIYMLMSRMNVKDYLQNPVQKEINEFNKYYDRTMKLVNKALKEIRQPSRLEFIQEIQTSLVNYKSSFTNVIDLMNKRDDIVNNTLDKDGKSIERLLTLVMRSAKKDKDMAASLATAEGIRTLLLARLYTAKFLKSNSKQDSSRVHHEFDQLEVELKDIQSNIQNPKRLKQLKEAIRLIEGYKVGVDKIIQLVATRNDIIHNKLNKLGPKIAQLSDDVKLSITKSQDTVGPEVQSVNSSVKNSVLIISIVIIIFIIILAMVIPTSIINAIKGLNNAILNLIETKDSSSRVKIVSNDEIAEVSNNFNTYLQTIDDGLIEDKELIVEAEAIMSRVKHGWYSVQIEKNTSNETLNGFKNSVNDMILATKQHFVNMNLVLEEYAKYDYRKELKLDGVEKGGVFEVLVNDINKLRDSITEMLVQNKQVGLTLDGSSDALLKNVDTLNTNSNSAAASLEETAAALEEVTGNISSTTNNVVQMAKYASEVTGSVNSGQELANQTSTAMDEINTEVTSISEAISVIDQIAFQTNILSLNAAVEAATAGEAGKGFAVVAQEVRNLAARSADAANEIKAIVEKANQKANNGKIIADKMIAGYTSLNTNISKTIELIENVETASKEQQTGIIQINDAVNSLDRQTQENANIASRTQTIAVQTDEIAKEIVASANEKEFKGKETVKAKKASSSKQEISTKKEVAKNKQTITTQNSQNVEKQIKPIASTNSDDEWASF